MIKGQRIVKGDASRLIEVAINLVNMVTADLVMTRRTVLVNSGKAETAKKATTASSIILEAEVLGQTKAVEMLLQPHLPLPVLSMVLRILIKSGTGAINHVLVSLLASVVKVTIVNLSIET